MAARLILALAALAAASPVSRIQQRDAAPVITSCTKPGLVALTFDDGPYQYTDIVLDHLKAAGMHATFFVNGQNWASIYDYPETVRRVVAEGHQIGSHTWSHPQMSKLSAQQVVDEMVELDDALIDIIGKSPTYMRPPFFDWSPKTLNILGPMGYKVIHTDIDTKDYEGNFGASVAALNAGLSAGGSVILAHEVHEMTAKKLVPEMIRIIKSRGLKAVTMGECIGDAPSNWYNTPEPEVPEETTPVEPEQPEETTPVEPEQPEETTPVEPEQPEETTPVEPEQPEETTPVEPEQPEETTPVEPEQPEETTPVEPEQPEETTPVEPELPEETTPVEPEVPETTTTPTYPEETTPIESELPEETAPTYPEEPKPTPTRTPGGSCRAKRRVSSN